MYSVRQPARHPEKLDGSAGAILNFTSADQLRAHYAALRKRLWTPRPIVKKAALHDAEAPHETVEAVIDAHSEPLAETPEEPPAAIDAIAAAPPHVESIMSLRPTHRVFGNEIVAAVSKVTGISKRDLISHRRLRPFTRARCIVYLLCSMLTSASFVQIGRWLGGRDHSTVIHGICEGHRRLDSLIDDIRSVCNLLQVEVPDFSSIRGYK